MPDGCLCPLPIPSSEAPRFRDIRFRGKSLGAIVRAVTRGAIHPMSGSHLDPDLRPESLPRRPGWRPAFGQVSAAQSQLERQRVGVGDLFLFFGWFRRTQWVADSLVYERRSPHLHLIFGWLQIGRILKPSCPGAKIPEWAHSHPHVSGAWFRDQSNTLYCASDTLCVPGLKSRRPGGGVFERFSPRLCLTAPGQKHRSIWSLPRAFYPPGTPPGLSYHRDKQRWTRRSTDVLLRTVGKGQEFVIDLAGRSGLADWLVDILGEAAQQQLPADGASRRRCSCWS
jgi:hypothetical protein